VQFCITVLFQEDVVNMWIKLYNKAPYSIKNWITLNSIKRIKIRAFKPFLIFSWQVFTVMGKVCM